MNSQTGLLYGGTSLFLVQAEAALLVAAFSFAVTYVILKVMQRAGGIQASEATEEEGLDRGEHGEAAYD